MKKDVGMSKPKNHVDCTYVGNSLFNFGSYVNLLCYYYPDLLYSSVGTCYMEVVCLILGTMLTSCVITILTLSTCFLVFDIPTSSFLFILLFLFDCFSEWWNIFLWITEIVV